MIITLKGADFSKNNIGTLSTWRIIKNLKNVTTSNTVTSIDKGAADKSYTATFTINSGYAFSSATVTMGGEDITSSLVWNTDKTSATLTIAEVTGNVIISIIATSTSTGGGGEGEGSTAWIDLPTTKAALGVTSTGTGRVSHNTATRFSTADDTKENGILVPSGSTITIKGLASGAYPLRMDYIYGTSAGPNPAQGSTTPIDGLAGSASNYDSSNYFPLNKTAEDVVSVTNSFGADYYFFFGFAGQTLTEGILAEYDTYDLKYKIS